MAVVDFALLRLRGGGGLGHEGEDLEFLGDEVEGVEGGVGAELDFGEVDLAAGGVVVVVGLQREGDLGEGAEFELQFLLVLVAGDFGVSAGGGVGGGEEGEVVAAGEVTLVELAVGF